MPKLYDIMAPIGKYEKNGQEKTRWLKCGMVVQTQAGKLAIKLEGLPVAPMPAEGATDAGLWLQCFEPNQPEDNLHTAPAPQGGFRQPAMQAPPMPNVAPQAPQAPQAAPVMGNPQFAPQTPQAAPQPVQMPPAAPVGDDDIPF